MKLLKWTGVTGKHVLHLNSEEAKDLIAILSDQIYEEKSSIKKPTMRLENGGFLQIEVKE